MIDIKSMTQEELGDLLRQLDEPAFRSSQIFAWLHRGATSFDDMSNLPKALRRKLEESCYITAPTVERKQVSRLDGTVKYLWRLRDGNCIETVLMHYHHGNTVCISSQVGCRMGCAFCASGIGGKIRDLKAWEMLDEYLICRKAAGEAINHIVLMGMGEPFDNYEEVSAFLRAVHDPSGADLSLRNITLSTCGLVPFIERFGNDFPQVNLAVSLHASNQKDREKIMPVAKGYPLERLIPACRAHAEKTGRRVTFEYALILGQNDSDEHCRQLASLLKGINCHANLIPLNPVTESGLASVSRQAAYGFAKKLEERGIPCTVRRQLGADIDAACGQLRKKHTCSEAR